MIPQWLVVINAIFLWLFEIAKAHLIQGSDALSLLELFVVLLSSTFTGFVWRSFNNGDLPDMLKIPLDVWLVVSPFRYSWKDDRASCYLE